MARPKIILTGIPDFKRVKQYDRKYINLPFDTVSNKEFLNLNISVYKIFIVLGIWSFKKSEESGWFPVTMKELKEDSGLSEATIRKAIKILEKMRFLDVGYVFEKNSNIHSSNCYRINGFKELVLPNN